jgi:LAO/AO transport system kinase
LKNLIQSALAGEVNAIARLITVAEAGGGPALEVQNAVFPHTGRAHLLGITGPAGAGKSTLISKLAQKLATEGQKIAVVACDPSSPNTGGALLGDRIRMGDLGRTSEGGARVFIRSVATRDSNGGLPLAAFRATDILDAAGYDTVIIETVGTGQNQVDIMQAAHTIIALSAPGLGDEIQAMKSGLLEVADIHVITKSDITGAGATLTEIRNALHMRQERESDRGSGELSWVPEVLAVNGLTGEGIDGLHDAIEGHHNFLKDGRNMQQRCQRMFRERVFREAISVLARSFRDAPGDQMTARINEVVRREKTPSQAAIDILAKHHEEQP